MRSGDAEQIFEKQRQRLHGVAYRILGRWTDAEDVVQDAWLRWIGADHAAIERPEAWLTTVTSRLALDTLRSARHQRETYVGPWLPEPVMTGSAPEEIAETADTLTFGFLVALETLSPVERAVFVLHDVFTLPYAEIAEVVDRSEGACRQIASRARRRIHARRPTATNDRRDDIDRLLHACVEAALLGEVDRLEQLFADDVVLVSDGGADRHAARRPVVGSDRVTRFLANLAGRRQEGTEALIIDVNGLPGLVLRHDGHAEVTVTIDCDESGTHITDIWIVVNPDKLRTLDALSAGAADSRDRPGSGGDGGGPTPGSR